MKIECRRIGKSTDALLDRVEKTYEVSFPKEERRAFSLVKELIDKEMRFSVFAIMSEGKYVGFITSWSFAGFTYVEHFAIEPSARNGGIGRQAMEAFIALCNSAIVLEVELPRSEISRRRIGFYERLGYELDGHVYFQPPYRSGEPEVEMRLMSHGGIDMERSFEDIRRCLHLHVYGVVS